MSTPSIPDLPVLEGERVRVRPWQLEDAPTVVAASLDEFIPVITSIEAHSSPEQAAAFIERQWTRPSTDGGHSRAIADIDTDEAIGQIGIWLGNARVGRAEIGYWVSPDHRRRGAAADGLDLIAAHALEHMGLHRLNLFIEPWNEGSRRAAARAGFREEALLEGWETYDDGKPRDMHVFVRVRDQ